ALPKVLHPVCGRPMLAWPIAAASEVGAGEVCIITSPGRDLSAVLRDGVLTVEQPVANGTGGAVRAARERIAAAASVGAPVLVLSGDVPLISAETISALLATHAENSASATVMAAVMD